MKNFYKRTIFWENLKRTFAVFSGPTTYALHELGAADKWVLAAAVFSFAGAVISIWMTDHDNDGYIDIFE